MSSRDSVSNQIPLPFGIFERFDFDAYLQEGNEEVVLQLQRISLREDISNIFL